MKSISIAALIAVTMALGSPAQDIDWAAATGTCESQCWENYWECYLFNPVCQGYEFCTVCEDEYQWCLDGCVQPTCYTDTCQSCQQPAAGVNNDGDGVPDRLEHDLAHYYFPHIMLQHVVGDLDQIYFYSGWAIPYTVTPWTGSVCDESLECLLIRYGTAYRYDWGDPFWGGSHLGDSEFYAVLVMRTTSWSTASGSVAYWQVIRDFTAAHWGASGDSSKYGAYGYCPPGCHSWDNSEELCKSHGQCLWFPGSCLGFSSQPGTTCSEFWQEGDCYFAGCTWFDPKCNPPEQLSCYSTSPVASARTLYAAEGKHALYHSDSECDAGGFSDDCPNNSYDWWPYKSGKLQNVGNPESHAGFDTVIQHPDGCALYDVWGGARFGNSTEYLKHFTFYFNWGLPAATGNPSASGNPFAFANARDQYLTCYGIAGRISSNCRDVSDFNDKKMCYSMSERTQSYCTQMTDRNLQLACYGMSINWSSNCRDITDATMKDFCYGVSGRSTGYCNNIGDGDTRRLCLAMATDDSAHCSGIGSSNDRQFCYGVSSHVNSYCASIQ